MNVLSSGYTFVRKILAMIKNGKQFNDLDESKDLESANNNNIEDLKTLYNRLQLRNEALRKILEIFERNEANIKTELFIKN
jgi:hypothetical protein